MTDPQHVTGDRRLVRVYAWFILLTTLLTVGIAAAVVLAQPEVHTAEAEVELLETPTRGAPLVPDVGTEREVAMAGTVAQAAAARMGTSVARARSGLSVSAVTDTNVLVIEYTAATPRRALRGAEAFTRSYVDTRNAARRARSVTVITQPELSPQGRSLSTPIILVAGLLAGVGLGTAGAFVWDRVADRVRSSGELRRSGLEVLATDVVVPAGGAPAALGSARSAGYLAGRLSSLTEHRRQRLTILVTGPRHTGAAAAALTASALASLGRRVVLVGADGPPSEVDALTDDPVTHGFYDVMTGRSTPEAALRPTEVEGLRVLGAGTDATTAPLDIDSLTVALGQLAARDIVVVAGPPLLESADAWVLADHADVVLLVADLRRLRRSDAARAVDLLRPLGSTRTGWVVTSRARRSRSRSGSSPADRVARHRAGGPDLAETVGDRSSP